MKSTRSTTQPPRTLKKHARARPACARRSPSTATTQKLHRCSLDLDGLEARGEVLLVRRRAPRRETMGCSIRPRARHCLCF